MTDPFKTNPYIFAAKKPDIAKTQNFLNKVSNDSTVRDNRETGAASFKQVLKGAKTRNHVQVEFEAPDAQKLSSNIRPGHSNNKDGQKNTLWSKA